jgi:diguanylate cyclase (GGDEF)-like protein
MVREGCATGVDAQRFEHPILSWFDIVDAPLLVVAGDALVVVAANAAAHRLFGPRRFESLPCGVEAFGGEKAVEALAGAIQAAEQAGAGEAVGVMCQLANGVHRLRFSAARLPDAPDRWLFTLSLEPPELALEDWRAGMADIMNLLPVGVEIYDKDLNALFYNLRADDLFLYDEKAILHHDEWFEFGFPDPVERAERLAEWHARVAAARRAPETVQFTEWSMRCRDGSARIVQFLFRFVGANFVMVLWDVTEQRQLEAELRRLASSDPLTGICNRRSFLEKAEAAFAGSRAEDGALSVLILDIDRFKAINDRHGHAAGDEVIRQTAARCSSLLRACDLFGRLGGEEFAVLLPATGPDEAAAVAGRLLEVMSREPVRVDAAAIPVRLSIGGTSRGSVDQTFAAVLARADQALYEAKNTGRGRAVFLAP